MGKFELNKSTMDGQMVRGGAKKARPDVTRMRLAGQAFTVGLLAAGRAEGVHADAPAALPVGDSHGIAPSQKGALGHKLELGGIATRPDSLGQHESVGHNELPRLRVGNVELSRLAADDVNAMLQNKKVLEHLPSLCQKPEFHKFLGACLKNQHVMESFRSMCLDQEFVKCVSDLRQKPEFVESFRPLLEKKEIVDSLSSLAKDEALMHNLNSIQEHHEGPSLEKPVRRELRSKKKKEESDSPGPLEVVGIAAAVSIALCLCQLAAPDRRDPRYYAREPRV